MIKENKYVYLYFALALIIISAVITPAYAKFTHDYNTEDDAVGISFDFSIKIQDVEEYESISVDANDAKIFNIKIDNRTNNNIYYGVWYRMIEPTSINENIVIARLDDSEANTSGEIRPNTNVIVSIIVKNKTDKNIKIDFGVSSSDVDANNIEYLEGKRLISGIDEIKYLNEMSDGSYVNYTGNNGCSGNNCSGENVNYINKDNKGYCADNKHKFEKNGWQIAYIEDDSVYLISAGSLECIATSENGSLSLNNKKLDNFEKTNGTPKHITNLNKEALKYCNEDYTLDGVCNNNTAWAFNDEDFKKINNMPTKICYKMHSEACDGFNDIITGSGDYWLATNFEKGITNYYWNSETNYLLDADSSNSYGLRAVIKLDPNVYIVDGEGTIDNPYKIANEFIKENQ